MNLNRIWESITGSPHTHANSQMVRSATNSLERVTEELASVVKPYAEAEDPLVMFMTDTFNRRQFPGSNGNGSA